MRKQAAIESIRAAGAESVNRVKRSFCSYYQLVVITADFMIIVKYNQWGWPWPLVTSHARRSEPPTWQLVRRDVDLVSDVLPFGGLWYAEPNAIGYPKFFSRSHRAGSCEPSLATLAAQFAPQRSDAESSQTEQRKC